MSRRWLLVVCALGGGASHVIAQPSIDAQPHVEAGVKAYQAADYETAIREFEIAYALNEDPVLLYALAQAQRQAGDCDRAIGMYRRYLLSKPSDAQRAAANTGISLCAPPPVPVPEEPQDGPPPNSVPQRQFDASAWYEDRLGGGLILGGVALAGIGATFLVLASRSAQAASEPGSRREFLEHLDDATLRRRIGIISLAASSGLVIAGVVRYVTRSGEPSSSVSIAVTAGATSVVVGGRF